MILTTDSLEFLKHLRSFKDKYEFHIISDKLSEFGLKTYVQKIDFLETLQSKHWI